MKDELGSNLDTTKDTADVKRGTPTTTVLSEP